MNYRQIRKYLDFLLFGSGIVFILINCCKKDKENSSNNDTTRVVTNNLTAIIDGKTFSIEGITKIHQFDYTTTFGFAGTELLHVEFADTLKTGSYSLGNDKIAFIDYSQD